MSALFTCDEPVTWRKVRDKYWDVVEARRRGKAPSKLLTLDKWYQEELPAAISSRTERHVTHLELVKLMEWKLTRGKFRPRLQQLVESNIADTVEKCSKMAFSLLPDVHAAITELSALKGVGPATASAVLAAGAPEQAAFMSDEAMESIPGLTPIQYTAKHYILYLTKMFEQTKKLNKCCGNSSLPCPELHTESYDLMSRVTRENNADKLKAVVMPPFHLNMDPLQDWTPQRLEQCLWALSVATKLQLSVLQSISVSNETTSKDEDNP